MSWKMCALFVTLVLLTACTAGSNTVAGQANASGELAGFFSGFWHGMISPFAWFFSLFSSSIGIYEVHNNGGWYNFGFILGINSLGGVGSVSLRKSRRTKRFHSSNTYLYRT